MTICNVEDYTSSGWDSAASASQSARAYCEHLERGEILYFPQSPIALSQEDREFLLSAEQAGTRLHKNIAYRPAQDRVTGLSNETSATDLANVRAVMGRFSGNVVKFVSDFLKPYDGKWKLDYASYRPIEEEGRDLATRSRNDLVHVDNFPTRPTNGDLIMRVFLNINPTQNRVWVTGPPFHEVVDEHAPKAGLAEVAARVGSALAGVTRTAVRARKALGLPLIDRPPYDQFMHNFHNYMKETEGFQKTVRKERSEFPPGSTWIVFTDKVPHAVMSGRCALEQTFIISKEALVLPELAPIRILEKMTGQALSRR
ncbi:MAG: Kdo hydroxylase family protein [Candidatus Sumerlaeaceae bacterium]